MSAEALPPDQAERVIAALEVMLFRLGNRQARVAAKLGVSQQHVSRLLRRAGGGPGPELAKAVAGYFDVNPDDLLLGRVTLSLDGEFQRFADHPKWPAILREIHTRLPTLPDSALEAVGNIRHPDPPRLTADFIASLAIAWAAAPSR